MPISAKIFFKRVLKMVIFYTSDLWLVLKPLQSECKLGMHSSQGHRQGVFRNGKKYF